MAKINVNIPSIGTATIQQALSASDKDRNGKVTKNELKNYLKALNKKPDAAQKAATNTLINNFSQFTRPTALGGPGNAIESSYVQLLSSVDGDRSTVSDKDFNTTNLLSRGGGIRALALSINA